MRREREEKMEKCKEVFSQGALNIAVTISRDRHTSCALEHEKSKEEAKHIRGKNTFLER